MTVAAARVPVLMYHRVEEAADPRDPHYCIAADLFAQHMHTLASRGWRGCSLEAFLDWANGSGLLPEKSVLVTFDDGFAGVADYAAPVLKELNWPAIVFVIAGLTSKHASWAANEAAGRKHALLSLQQLGAILASGLSVQSHSLTHPDLTSISDSQLSEELEASRAEIATLTGQRPATVAYPFGKCDERVVAAAERAGYRAAFTTQPGFNRPPMDLYRIRRLDMRGTDTAAVARRKVELGTNDGSLGAAASYAWQRVVGRLVSR